MKPSRTSITRGILLFTFLGHVCALVADKDNLILVRSTIKNMNKDLKTKNMDGLMVNGLTLDFKVGSIFIEKGLIGNFSSIALRNVPQKCINFTYDGVTEYDFELTVGLDELTIWMKFNLTLMRFFQGSARLEAFTHGDSATIKGNVYLNREGQGSCKAVLNDASLKEVGKLNVNISPDNVINSFVSYLTEVGVNRLLVLALPYLNHLVSSYSHLESFKELFSDLVCRSLKK